MRQQNGKRGAPAICDGAENALREEVIGDALELCLVSSRLLARMSGSNQALETVPTSKRPLNKRLPSNRRA